MAYLAQSAIFIFVAGWLISHEPKMGGPAAGFLAYVVAYGFTLACSWLGDVFRQRWKATGSHNVQPYVGKR